ncbi:MAG: Spy/CpxP family protein refolding chaperone [Acidobacteriaceae bacterium]
MKRHLAQVVVIMLAFACIAVAQGGPGAGMGHGPQMGMPCPMEGGGPGMGHGMGPGMGHGGMGMGMGGKWWKNSELVKKLGLSDSQVQQIEKAFQDHRMQLIDLRAALEKQEVAMQPLVDAERPDEAKVTAQIDKVAQARAELEKSNAKMLLAIRRILTVEQWKQLQAQSMGPMHGPGSMNRGVAGPSGL